jgi:hypothetical protein
MPALPRDGTRSSWPGRQEVAHVLPLAGGFAQQDAGGYVFLVVFIVLSSAMAIACLRYNKPLGDLLWHSGAYPQWAQNRQTRPGPSGRYPTLTFVGCLALSFAVLGVVAVVGSARA